MDVEVEVDALYCIVLYCICIVYYKGATFCYKFQHVTMDRIQLQGASD